MAKSRPSGAARKADANSGFLREENNITPAKEWDISHSPLSPADVSPQSALKKLQDGFQVTSYDGSNITFGQEILDHWQKEKNKSQKDIDGRLSRLEMATQTVQNPREVWIQGKQKAYVQVFVKKNGGAKGCVVFAKDNNVVRSYYPRSISSLDKARHGEQIK
jgi:hypothetical protein